MSWQIGMLATGGKRDMPISVTPERGIALGN
jgi:hypothetical protein